MLNKLFPLLLVLVFFASCSKEEITTSETSSTTEVVTTQTEVAITVRTSNGVTKPNYIVMAFDRVFNPTTSTPADRIKQTTSNSSGIATFDLNDIISSNKTIYFEAFTKNSQGNYILESQSRTQVSVKKNHNHTAEILVD